MSYELGVSVYIMPCILPWPGKKHQGGLYNRDKLWYGYCDKMTTFQPTAVLSCNHFSHKHPCYSCYMAITPKGWVGRLFASPWLNFDPSFVLSWGSQWAICSLWAGTGTFWSCLCSHAHFRRHPFPCTAHHKKRHKPRLWYTPANHKLSKTACRCRHAHPYSSYQREAAPTQNSPTLCFLVSFWPFLISLISFLI